MYGASHISHRKVVARLWGDSLPAAVAAQAEEKKAVDAQAEVAAFDRKNHAGASEALAGQLKEAIREGAAELMREKRIVSGAVNIRTNREKMKARPQGASTRRAAPHGVRRAGVFGSGRGPGGVGESGEGWGLRKGRWQRLLTINWRKDLEA